MAQRNPRFNLVRLRVPPTAADPEASANVRKINDNFQALRDQIEKLTLDNGLVTVALIDHGELAGLADDDHTQYHNDARWDIRFATKETLEGIASVAQGDVLYYDGSSWVRLPAGTVGHVLTTAGAGADPSWQAASGGGGGSWLSSGSIGWIWSSGFPVEIE